MGLCSAPGTAFAWLSLGLALVPWQNLAAQGRSSSSFHSDYRQTLKYKIFPVQSQLQASADPKTLAWEFLKAEAASFGLSPELSSLSLQSQQESLIGWHLRFSQSRGGVPIEGAEIIVSLLKANHQIYEVYNSSQPESLSLASNTPSISLDEAYDQAWNYLAVEGRLFEAPLGKLVYLPDGKGLQAAWRIELSTTAPYGAFRIYVDAESGKILRAEDQRVSHKPWTRQPELRGRAAIKDRKTAFREWDDSQLKLVDDGAVTAATGRARVFDPDPRTTLQNNSLEDSTTATAFTAAYLQRELKDISYTGSKYKLEGPWVKIIDWDPPTTAPSTTADGQWTALRGNNAFNDAMTYFHIDQSQRYLQSLGFTGTRGIQARPIEADSNGVSGDDNSYFQPSSNRLSFGHGCVDDNEDADVILHEYGHAIHFSINPSWSGGDTGAMGEGFGDYWAASYSLSTSNGAQFLPNLIYSWDGHGERDSCWSGRVLNAMTARYNPAQSYAAHSPIEGGFQSDELWSTPLFQSLLTLRSLGVRREEVDTIVIQAQFGLGSAVTMRDMAQSILLSAQQLYPSGPHAGVFKENFLRHNIIEEPHAVLNAKLSQTLDASGNGVIVPGEEVDLRFTVQNSGNLVATRVMATLASVDNQASVLQGSSALPDIEAGRSAVNQDALRIRVNSELACGSLVKLLLSVQYDEGKSSSFPVELRVGQPVGVAVTSSPNLAIPDADSRGVGSFIDVQSSGRVSDQFKVGVRIKHTYRGDLKVSLISPSGKQVLLHDRSGISEDDLIGVYPRTLQPKESLSKILAEPLNGRWQLQVADLASSDLGTLESWSLEDVSTYQCQ